MKKFLINVLALAFVCVVLTAGIGIIKDPYNVFSWNNMKQKNAAPNYNYIKTRYLIENPDKFDTYVFGSSRVGNIHVEKMEDCRAYNLFYYSCPLSENLETLNVLLENDVVVKKIYLGVDAMSYTIDPAGHYEDPMSCTYKTLHGHLFKFAKLYLNPSTIYESCFIKPTETGILGLDTIYDYGWWCDYDNGMVMGEEAFGGVLGGSFLMEETLEDMRAFVKVCEDNHIELTVFTNPMYKDSYQSAIEEADYIHFLEELKKITPFYDFSGINEVTTNHINYTDVSHANAEVGDMMLDVILNGADYGDFGKYVE